MKILIAAALLCILPCLAGDVPRVTLHVRQNTQVGLTSAPILMPLKCDSDGNLYVRFWDNDTQLGAPVTKIGRDGKLLAKFSFENLHEIGSVGVVDFVADRGQLSAIVGGSKGQYLAKFSREGKFQSATPLSLNRDILPHRLVVIGGGKLLVTAEKVTEVGDGAAREPKTIIVDESGNIARYVDTKETIPSDNSGKTAPEDVRSLERSQVVSDGAGLVYIMRPSAPALVISISPSGEVLQKYPVDTPQAGYVAQSLQVNGGRIAVSFIETDGQHYGPKSLTRVIDAATGIPLIDYMAPPELDGALECYVAPSQFSMFFGGKDERFRLVTLSEP